MFLVADKLAAEIFWLNWMTAEYKFSFSANIPCANIFSLAISPLMGFN